MIYPLGSAIQRLNNRGLVNNSSKRSLFTAHTVLCERRILKSRLAEDLVEWSTYPIVNNSKHTLRYNNNNKQQSLFFLNSPIFLDENAKQTDAPLHARYILK